MNERICLIRENILNTLPSVDINRAVIFTNAHKENTSMPLVMRNAIALKKMFEDLPISIRDNELIVGSPTLQPRACQVFPEVQSGWLGAELDKLSTRELDPLLLGQEDKKILEEEVLPFWKGKTINERVYCQLDRKTKDFLYKDPNVYPTQPSCLIDNFSLLEKGIGTVVPNYEKILNNGVDKIIEEIEKAEESLTITNPQNISKKTFYEAAKIVLRGLVRFAERYSILAMEMAKNEPDIVRKSELEQIAKICSKVPAQRPSTFYEAIQCFWFIHLAVRMEMSGHSLSPGRFDQYMYEFYENDKTTEEETKKQKALELVECLFLKFSELMLLVSTSTSRLYAGVPQWQNLNLGGKKSNGEDATNDLSYICLKAMSELLLVQPDISVRIHSQTPTKFLREACRLAKLGTGHPKFYNDELITLSMAAKGLSLEESRDYSIMGCVEPRAKGEGVHITGGFVNMPLALVLALHNGALPGTNKVLGPATGKIEDFDTFEKLEEAVRTQMGKMIEHLFIINSYGEKAYSEIIATPFLSSLTPGCIEQGKTLQEGGAKYNFGPAVNMIGVTDAGDSMYAIKKVVYEDKMITLEELVDVLDNNFVGHEDLRAYLLYRIDKYGNDKDGPDTCVRNIVHMGNDLVMNYKNIFGGQADAGIIPVTSGIAFGKVIGALPSGRKSGDPYADSASPMPGMDVNGPTAMLCSVGKMDAAKMRNGTLLNIKINPLAVSSEEGLARLENLIRGGFDAGVWHMQINCISAETLRDAQRKPQEYKNLLVRVAGYSAFFVNLHSEVQEDIIKRTEFCAI